MDSRKRLRARPRRIHPVSRMSSHQAWINMTLFSSPAISLLSALPNSKEAVAALAAGDAAGAHAKAQGWIYAGYKMTIFSTAEEQQREPLEIGGKVLFYLDFALRTAGGDVRVVAPWRAKCFKIAS